MAESQTITAYCPVCRKAGRTREQHHRYPSRLGPPNWVWGKCVVCGRERRLSNTTNDRYAELGAQLRERA